MRTPVALIAGGERVAADALREALAAGGVRATILDRTAPPVHVDAVVVNPGATWRAPSWRVCLASVYEWTTVALPLLGDRGALVACGPAAVAGPGAGYPEYVKARLALGHWARDVETQSCGVTPVVVWCTGASELAGAIIDRLGSVPPLGSEGVAVNV